MWPIQDTEWLTCTHSSQNVTCICHVNNGSANVLTLKTSRRFPAGTLVTCPVWRARIRWALWCILFKTKQMIQLLIHPRSVGWREMKKYQSDRDVAKACSCLMLWVKLSRSPAECYFFSYKHSCTRLFFSRSFRCYSVLCIQTHPWNLKQPGASRFLTETDTV